MDACTPTPDQDAGSLKIFNFIRIFQGLGYQVTFAPDNLAYIERYTPALQRLGVQCLYRDYTPSLRAHLEVEGSKYDVILSCRPDETEKHLTDFRSLCPRAKVLFDTADLHFLREQRLAEILETEPAMLVHPFDDEEIIAGQGTAALELISEVQQLDVVSAPVGGGGLIGGTALAAKAMLPGIRVIGAEPSQADDALRSFRTGVRQAVNAPRTIADGLRGSIGTRNFELLRSHVDDVVSVDEADIVAAMRVVLDDLKQLIEPSSAVPVAALLAGKIGAAGQRVGIVISGGNVDLSLCPFLRGDSGVK